MLKLKVCNRHNKSRHLTSIIDHHAAKDMQIKVLNIATSKIKYAYDQ